MVNKLELKFPWKLLENLSTNSTNKFQCQSSSNDSFILDVTRETDNVILCCQLPQSGLIHVDKFVKILDQTRGNDARELLSTIQVQYETKPSLKSDPLTISEFVHGKGISADLMKDHKRKRLKKKHEDFISTEEEEERVVTSLSTSAFVCDPSNYKCDECGVVSESYRRFFCHMQKHGGLKPFSCSQCDFSAAFPSLLVRHVRSVHGDVQLSRSSTDLFSNPGYSATEEGTTAKSQEPFSAGKPPPEVVSIEIEVYPGDMSESGVTRAQAGNGTIEVTDLSAASVEHSEVAFISQKQVKILGGPNIDPKLRHVGKNYQFVIDEFCSIVANHFQCKLCFSKFRKRCQFMDHLYSNHEDCQPYHCLLCDYRTRGKPNVYMHNAYKHGKNRKHSCDQCGSRFQTQSKLRYHQQTHSDIDHWCTECQTRFNTIHTLRDHMRRSHGEKTYQCQQCQRKFATSYSLKVHANVHVSGRRWKCMYCQKLYRSKQSLKIHLHSHTTVFHCQICDKDIHSYSAFIVHKNLHDPKAKKHACTQCDKSFPSKKARDHHMIVKHSDSTELKHKCQECDKRFKLVEQLNSHMICHSKNKPWVCDICHLSFKRQSTLCTHRKQHGELLKAPFICTFCGIQFPDYNNLSRHLIHEEKAGLCQICDRLFSSKPLLGQHMISAHHDQSGSVLQQYLTQPFDQDHALVHQPVDVVNDVQVAPAKTKTKIIHSGNGSSVVSQISTTPVVEASHQNPPVETSLSMQLVAESPHLRQPVVEAPDLRQQPVTEALRLRHPLADAPLRQPVVETKTPGLRTLTICDPSANTIQVETIDVQDLSDV